ncbi:MAG TPA: tRNA lysidine(34) synthetase TilS, partial [Chitinophagaceae bacterium]
SERDEDFVREIGKKYEVEVLVKKFDTEKYAEEKKIGIQEAARDLRYEWFKEIVNPQSSIANDQKNSTHDSRFTIHLLTAHHADDNIETILMNFCRGTGLDGLTGIPVGQVYVKRPLLSFWKEELIAFAKENKLEFVEDSSNQSLKYTRNLFRNEIIPLISKAFPQVKSNLQDNIDRFKDIDKLYHISVAELKKKLCKTKKNEIHISVKQLMSYKNRALIFEIISEYGFSEKQIDEVIKLAESDSGKFVEAPSGHRIIKFRNWFIISQKNLNDAETIVIEEGTKNIQHSNFKLQISNLKSQTTNFKLPTSNSIACLDAKEISFHLILRKWKQGDYFYPLGMKKKKKLARFFIDQKLSKTDREKIWVIEMNKKIIWVVGLRIDDRSKVTEKTTSIFKISLETS